MRFRTAVCLAALAFGADCSTMHAQTLKTIASFNGTNGSSPAAGLVADSQGNLYGTTFEGGAFMAGSVFRIDGITHALSTVASFAGTDGARPQAGVLLDAAGNLYGTTTIGGTYGWGTVFQVSASTHQIMALHSFSGYDGQYPQSSLIGDAAGNVYGTTSNNGGVNIHGTVFSVRLGTNAFSTVANFDGTNGQVPIAGLVPSPKGDFYGTTAGGGANGDGTIYRFSASSHALMTVASLGGGYGGPPGALTVDADGNLFGTTTFGGPSNLGTIFEFVASTQQLLTLATFNGPNGGEPEGGVIRDANGILYGTTSVGGAYNYGSVFKFDPSTGGITTLASFNGGEVTGPMGGLTFGADGNLYGTTWGGGDSGMGTVFEVSVPEPGLGGVTLVAIIVLRRRRESA